MAGLAVAGFAPAATWAVVRAPNATLWPSFQPEIFAASGVATISLSLAGSGHASFDGRHAVLGEVLAPHAAKAGHVVVGDGGGERLAVGPERDDEKIRSARYGCDLGKPGKPVGTCPRRRGRSGSRRSRSAPGGPRHGWRPGRPGRRTGCAGRRLWRPWRVRLRDPAGARQRNTRSIAGARSPGTGTRPPALPGSSPCAPSSPPHTHPSRPWRLLRLWVRDERQQRASARERGLVLAPQPSLGREKLGELEGSASCEGQI